MDRNYSKSGAFAADYRILVQLVDKRWAENSRASQVKRGGEPSSAALTTGGATSKSKNRGMRTARSLIEIIKVPSPG